MNKKYKLSKTTKNYYIDITAFLPFLLLLITGIIMLVYHTGKPYSETILNLNRAIWLNIHISFAVISFVLITIHLSFHLNWFKKLFSGKRKNKHWIKNLTLLILFFLATITAVFPWLILDENETSNLLLGLHNKIGLLIIIFFIIHLFSYYKWLISMTRKLLQIT